MRRVRADQSDSQRKMVHMRVTSSQKRKKFISQ
jgi:hypothetical protein